MFFRFFILSIMCFSNVSFAESSGDGHGIVVQDQYSEPFSNGRYVVEYNSNEYEGISREDGFIPLNDYLNKEVIIRIYVYQDNPDNYEVLRVNVGGLESIDTIVGLKQRLSNLDYFIGFFDEKMDDNTVIALKALQRDKGLEITGEFDKETRDWLIANDSVD